MVRWESDEESASAFGPPATGRREPTRQTRLPRVETHEDDTETSALVAVEDPLRVNLPVARLPVSVVPELPLLLLGELQNGIQSTRKYSGQIALLFLAISATKVDGFMCM